MSVTSLKNLNPQFCCCYWDNLLFLLREVVVVVFCCCCCWDKCNFKWKIACNRMYGPLMNPSPCLALVWHCYKILFNRGPKYIFQAIKRRWWWCVLVDNWIQKLHPMSNVLSLLWDCKLDIDREVSDCVIAKSRMTHPYCLRWPTKQTRRWKTLQSWNEKINWTCWFELVKIFQKCVELEY